MKIIHSDFKKGIEKGTVRFRLDQKEDAWHLFKLIAPGDVISGKTERKIKLGGEGEKGTVLKKTFWLEIEAEKTDLQGDDIRINGCVTLDYDDIPKGSHQSISFSINDEGTLLKERWSLLDRQRLEQAGATKQLHILAVVFDREEAFIAQFTHRGFEIITHEKGDVARKEYGEGKENFFARLAGVLAEMNERLAPAKIILASPSFWKEYLMKELSPGVKSKAALATVSTSDETAFHELLRRPELAQIFAEDRTAQEEKALDEALAAVRNDLGCYGAQAFEESVAQGNLGRVLVSEEAFTGATPVEKEALEKLLMQAESVGAEISILTQDASQRKLSPFKGILGVKRWKSM